MVCASSSFPYDRPMENEKTVKQVKKREVPRESLKTCAEPWLCLDSLSIYFANLSLAE